MSSISAQSLVAAGLYTVIAMLSAAAALSAGRQRLQGRLSYAWLGLAAFFALLVMVRLFDLEEIGRAELRAFFRARGAYEMRGEIQRPLAVVLLLAIAACGGWFTFRILPSACGKAEQAICLAMMSAAGMLALIVLRMISLHMTDALLYGPLKLNWVADIGMACLVAASAVYFLCIARGKN